MSVQAKRCPHVPVTIFAFTVDINVSTKWGQLELTIARAFEGCHSVAVDSMWYGEIMGQCEATNAAKGRNAILSAHCPLPPELLLLQMHFRAMHTNCLTPLHMPLVCFHGLLFQTSLCYACVLLVPFHTSAPPSSVQCLCASNTRC